MSAQKTPAPASPVTHATTTGMTGGGFYNQNSTPQWDATAAVLEHLEAAADALPIDGNGPVCLADFGCSEGRNSIAALSRPVTRLVRRTDRPIQTIHSDLPTNDFSSLLRSLRPEGHSVFGHPNVYSSVVGGSMYDQLLPDRSLHMATTFNAIGFLSRKPIATLPGYIFPNGPSVVRNNGFVTEEDQAAFSELARQDIATFLRARAKELVPGGKLLLQVFGANETASTCDGIYDLLNDAILCFVEDGSISKDVYEAYYQPVYMRTLEELTGPVNDPDLGVAGLFELDHSTSYEIPVSFNQRFAADGNLEAYARDYVNFFRAFTEAVLRNSLPATDERDRLVERIYDKAIALLKVSPDLYPFRYIAVAALMTRTGN
ncbi:hypothetical protein [Roseibium alexandrii]|uniref:SAM dependent carboxyl methyltransferase n=1 Tax=Roseibium alexandrii TaxID=388408 RepID=A0A0M7AA90_9HYPH|nr:hypothetical protein [Roseibium alexandrii]CTQ71150.1 SAM dependent carboxyl methyltransferase [Roseibium alexandrii]